MSAIKRVVVLLALAGAGSLRGPATASAGLGIEPYLASRMLQGDAGDLYETGLATGISASWSFPLFPLRPRASIDFSDHDAKTAGGDAFEGNLWAVDVVWDIGAGLFVPYILAGGGVSNLESDPSPGETQSAYDSGAGFGRVGAGLRAGLGRRLAATAEVDYLRGGEGNELTTGRAGELEILDLRFGLLLGL